jgi:hypothetical protein
MQFITNFTIKTLFSEAEIFFKMCSQNAGNAISETQILKMSWGHAQKPIEIINNTRLRYYSAHSHWGFSLFSVTDYIKYYVHVTYLA